MNALRSIPALLYLITMVLVPYGHMPLHAAEHAEIAEHHGCSHDHPGQDSGTPSEPIHSDDCSLCDLTVLPADLPQVFTTVWWSFNLDVQNETANICIGATIIFDHRARAPPFATV